MPTPLPACRAARTWYWAVTDVVFGQTSPQGRLPFDLPSSAPAVEDSRSDILFDTADPLFRFGDGIGFRG
jgi:beta-glucosidase